MAIRAKDWSQIFGEILVDVYVELKGGEGDRVINNKVDLMNWWNTPRNQKRREFQGGYDNCSAFWEESKRERERARARERTENRSLE